MDDLSVCRSVRIRTCVGRSVGLSSALWQNGGSDPDAVWHHRSDGFRNEAVVGFGDRSTGRGTFGGEFWARHCNQWGLYGVCVRQRRDAALFPNYLGKLVKLCFLHLLLWMNNIKKCIKALLGIKRRHYSQCHYCITCTTSFPEAKLIWPKKISVFAWRHHVIVLGTIFKTWGIKLIIAKSTHSLAPCFFSVTLHLSHLEWPKIQDC